MDKLLSPEGASSLGVMNVISIVAISTGLVDEFSNESSSIDVG